MKKNKFGLRQRIYGVASGLAYCCPLQFKYELINRESTRTEDTIFLHSSAVALDIQRAFERLKGEYERRKKKP